MNQPYCRINQKITCKVLNIEEEVLWNGFYKVNVTIKRYVYRIKIALLTVPSSFSDILCDLYCVCRCSLKLHVAAFALQMADEHFSPT